jgi:phenylalanyl-tRNA synthetase alpha chain
MVSTKHCFDDLLIPPDHVSRSYSDTYYIDADHCLRTHTSAHQSTLIASGESQFLCTGDVYRRDEIDSSHYPVFHQMEGVKMFPLGTPTKVIEDDLKSVLSGMAKTLFGDVEMRWVDAYFPFTEPSYELEIFFNGEWLEVLGSGVIQQQIIRNAGQGEQPGWAFGLGLERLAMVLFEIPDIRLFWSSDPRFHQQFKSGEIIKFKEYSKYPPVHRDISFWTGGKEFHPNDLCEIVRGVCIEEDLVEKVELIDEFVHPKTKKTSNCFRVTYRSMDRSLTNKEVDDIHFQVRDNAVTDLKIEIR